MELFGFESIFVSIVKKTNIPGLFDFEENNTI